MSEKPTVEDVYRSISGFDDIAIESMFRKELADLSPVKTTRALVFTLKRREGLDDAAAFKAVMDMGLGDLNDTFADGDQEQPGIIADLADGPGKAATSDAPSGGPGSS